jgi:hypothetical protein
MNISDTQLKTYIDQIFSRYDRDNSGSLDSSELANFFNDLFQIMGYNMRVNSKPAKPLCPLTAIMTVGLTRWSFSVPSSKLVVEDNLNREATANKAAMASRVVMVSKVAMDNQANKVATGNKEAMGNNKGGMANRVVMGNQDSKEAMGNPVMDNREVMVSRVVMDNQDSKVVMDSLATVNLVNQVREVTANLVNMANKALTNRKNGDIQYITHKFLLEEKL